MNNYYMKDFHLGCNAFLFLDINFKKIISNIELLDF